jgi:Ca2+-binding EF-hand superfamily protein
MRACAQKIVAKFDKGNGKINMDELREILTDLDKDKHPPLPKDLL